MTRLLPSSETEVAASPIPRDLSTLRSFSLFPVRARLRMSRRRLATLMAGKFCRVCVPRAPVPSYRSFRPETRRQHVLSPLSNVKPKRKTSD